MGNKVNDILHMGRAVELAECGLGRVSPNPVVGAVIVGVDGAVLGEGFHGEYGGPHAEVVAVNSVADRSLLHGATIYVTLEPCSHYGKTPPCADLLVECGFGRVVIGVEDPFVEVRGAGIRRLRAAGIQVDVGVCAAECWEVNRRFLTSVTLGRPWVTLKWAQTQDGYIDAVRCSSVPAAWFTGPEAKQLVHLWRSHEDAIMVGRRTVEQDNPQLTVRDVSPDLVGKNPLRVVVSSTPIAPQFRVMDAEAETVVVSGRGGLRSVLGQLNQRGVRSVIVEGGAELLGGFLSEGLWDEACVFTAQHPLQHYYPQLPAVEGIAAPDFLARMAGCQHPPVRSEAVGSSFLQVFRRQ